MLIFPGNDFFPLPVSHFFQSFSGSGVGACALRALRPNPIGVLGHLGHQTGPNALNS
jgi:hypothetical protein